jgi:transcription elongation factor Elf1
MSVPPRPESAAAKPSRWHMYRCPVCGHRDEIDLDAGMPAPVSCSHCEAELEVVVRSPEEAAATATVATRRRRVR